MANVKFAYGTKTALYTSTTGFDDGCIYFGTSARKIWLRQGNSITTFDGTNNCANSRRISIGGSLINYTGYDMCQIQNRPDDYGASNTAGASNTSWYNTYGQGVASAANVCNDSYYDGFDYAMSNYTSVPPLETAVKIVVAVSPFYMSYVGKGGQSMTNASYLPNGCIVECYRTTETGYPSDSNVYDSYSPNGAMFVGKCFAGVTGSGTYTGFGEVRLELCCNGTNAISASFYTCKAGSSTFSTNSHSCVSACYAYGYEYSYPNIEKYVYPLAIYY